MKEIWKTIDKYEDYQISNLGRIKSNKQKNERILKISISKFGYCRVGLFNNKYKNKKELVHKLVAETFLNKNDFKFMDYEKLSEIKENDLEVNHIDGNKQNNCVNNLEWCTKCYNQKHSYIIGLKKSKKNYNNYRSKSINQYDLNGNFIKEWANKRDIERTLGFNNRNITNCCKNKIKKSYNYIWKYKEEN